MGPHRGWSLGLMPRTETPPPISEGRTWKASRWEHLSRSQQSRGQSLASRACALARAWERKSVLAIKLGAKAGCSLEALNFRMPSRVFLYRGGEFPGPHLATVNRVPWPAISVTAAETRPFRHRKPPIPLKTIGSKKPKLLRFMEGNCQRRLLAGSSELSNPPPKFALCPVFPARCRSLGVCGRRLS